MSMSFKELEVFRDHYFDIYYELVNKIDLKFKKAMKAKSSSVRDARKDKFLGMID